LAGPVLAAAAAVSAGSLVELLTLLDRHEPGVAVAIARHRRAKALLRAALLEVGQDIEG